MSQVLELHGEAGDCCWNPKVCHRRRSHYRNRAEVNAKRRGERRKLVEEKGIEASGVESIAVQMVAPAVALLYLYRQKPKDTHLHAVAVTVWRGDQKLAATQPIHCMGMTNRQVNQYLRQVLAVLGDRYGIKQFEPEIRLEPIECPIQPCPLKEI